MRGKMIGVPVSAAEKRDPELHTEMETLRAEREERLNAEEAQAERERMIARAHEIIGRVQANTLMAKFADVSSLVHLKNIKDSKIYRDLPMVGTWEKYCEYIGLSRQKVDEDLANLAVLGEDFLLTCQQFQIGYRDLRKLRLLTHNGAIQVDDNAITIEGETITVDEEHAPEIQAAVSALLEKHTSLSQRVEKLEKQKDAIVKEETKGLTAEKDALVKEVRRLQAFDPATIDPAEFEGQFAEIRKSLVYTATLIGKLVIMDGLEENPELAARIEGQVAETEAQAAFLRRQWVDKFNLFGA